jgi:hypothetical protein
MFRRGPWIRSQGRAILTSQWANSNVERRPASNAWTALAEREFDTKHGLDAERGTALGYRRRC